MLFKLGLLFLGLTACGLQPMLKKPDTSARSSAAKVNVSGIEGYLNYKFYETLLHHLSLTKLDSSVALNVVLSQTYMDISYGKDAAALRTQNIIIASYEIFQKGTLLKRGKVDSIASYNVDQNDEFSTLTGRMGTDEKVIQSLAEEVAREVYLATQPLS